MISRVLGSRIGILVGVILLLTGENDYELTKKVAQLKADFEGQAERFDGSELTSAQLADIFAGQSLFALKRLVFIDNPSGNPDLWKGIEAWAARLNGDTQLVFIEPKPDKRTSTYKWFKKNAEVLEFGAFDPRDQRGLIKWIEDHAKEKQVGLTSAQARHLADRVGANQWELAHAIDKLALAGEVSDEWIDAVAVASPTENVFALFETTLNGDVTRLQDMLVTLRQTEDAYRVFGLINTQALQLTALVYGGGDANRVASDSGAASAYPYQKLASYALRFSKGQAKDMVGALAASDLRLKSSDADPWMVLESTLVRMASLARR